MPDPNCSYEPRGKIYREVDTHVTLKLLDAQLARARVFGGSTSVSSRIARRPIFKIENVPIIGSNCLDNESRSITAQCIANAVAKFVEGHARVLLPVKHQKWIRILLRMSRGSLFRLLGDYHNSSHEFGLTVLIRNKSWREKIGIRVSVLVTKARCRRANMRWHSLRRHLDPFASSVDVPIPWELESPECRVDAHDGLGCLTLAVTRHPRWLRRTSVAGGIECSVVLAIN